MKIMLARGALALGVVGALALCLLLNRQSAEVEADSANKQDSIEHVSGPEATGGLNPVLEGRTRGNLPEPAAVPVEATTRPLRMAEDDAETRRIDLERMRRENQQERIAIGQMQKAITAIEAEVQKEGRDAKGRRHSKSRLLKGRQRVTSLETQTFSGANHVPVTSRGAGGVGQPHLSPSNGDDLIASATPSPAIAGPVNPKPGMLFKGYAVRGGNEMFELASQLAKCATVKTTVVQGEKFSFENFRDVHINQGVWEGFLKCKRSANCTFLLQQDTYADTGYALFVNGKKFISGRGQTSGMIDLKAGFNHIKVVTNTKDPVVISLKATGSTREPKPLAPKDFWYDEKPDESDMF